MPVWPGCYGIWAICSVYQWGGGQEESEAGNETSLEQADRQGMSLFAGQIRGVRQRTGVARAAARRHHTAPGSRHDLLRELIHRAA
jgi:hypothetical protein